MIYNQLYELMRDTIVMLALSDVNALDDLVADYLEEIEGDNHTFLHISNLLELQKQGLITDKVVESATALSQFVKDLPRHLWNVAAFKTDEQWLYIHDRANVILKELNTVSGKG